MRGFSKFFVTLLIGAAILFFVVREMGTEAMWAGISLFIGWGGLLILINTFFVLLAGALRWGQVLKSENENVPFLIILRYLVKGFTVDFLTPFSLFGGETVRIFLMEKEVGVKKSAFSVITDKILDVTMLFFFLLLGITLFVVYSVTPSDSLLFYAAGVIALVLFVLVLFYIKALQKESFLKWVFAIVGISRKYLDETENGRAIIEVEEKIIHFFSGKKRELVKGLAFSFLRHFFFVSRIFLIMFLITGSTDPGIAITVYGLVILAMFLPLPAALGSMEVILVLGLGAIGHEIGAGLTAATTLRGADLMVCAVGVILFIRLSFMSFYHQFNKFMERFAK